MSSCRSAVASGSIARLAESAKVASTAARRAGSVGANVGLHVSGVGSSVGSELGSGVGRGAGSLVGAGVGRSVGSGVGWCEGAREGVEVGRLVGGRVRAVAVTRCSFTRKPPVAPATACANASDEAMLSTDARKCSTSEAEAVASSSGPPAPDPAAPAPLAPLPPSELAPSSPLACAAQVTSQ